MQNMEHFLADRALSLRYEARRFPQTASVSAAWIRRAELWARRRRRNRLLNILAGYLRDIPSSSSTEVPA